MLKILTGRLRYFAAQNAVHEKAAQLGALLKYSPDQPRVPAGQSDGGQWVPWVGRPARSNSSESGPNGDEQHPNGGGGSVLLAGIFNELNRAKCDAQYEKDMFQCRFVSSARFRSACENQAMSRFVACMKDDLLPPFIYFS